MPARSLSFWIMIAAIVTTGIMVHPSFAALLTAPVDFALLLSLRWAARREGQAEERVRAEIRRKGFA